jgi:hypothetical protein
MITITNKINQEDINNSQQIDTMHKKLDKFIQNCLNKFKFVEVKSDIYSKVEKDKNSIISHKSTIPDLVIWNKPFNKNECFDMKDLNKYNKYPRIPFYLRLNNKEEKTKMKNNTLTKDEYSPIETFANFFDKLNIKEENELPSRNCDIIKQDENINSINEKEEDVEFNYGNNKTNYITPINKSKKTMNDYYQNQFKKNELLMNYVYSFLDKKGWLIFRNDGVYLSNYTSFELFTFLTNSLKNNTDLKMYTIGMQTDSIIFNGEQIYIILSQALPIILQKKQIEYQLMRKKKLKENTDNKLTKLNNEEKENISNNIKFNA